MTVTVTVVIMMSMLIPVSIGIIVSVITRVGETINLVFERFQLLDGRIDLCLHFLSFQTQKPNIFLVKFHFSQKFFMRICDF